MNKFILLIVTLLIQSCTNQMMSGFGKSSFSNASQESIDDYSSPTNQLNKTRELLDGASINFPTLTATGF